MSDLACDLACTSQLQEEFDAGAWIALDCDPSLVIKDRVSGWTPGKPKPIWTELVKLLGDEGQKVFQQIYLAES